MMKLPTTEDFSRVVCLRRRKEVPNPDMTVDEVFDCGIRTWAKFEPVHGLTMRAEAQTAEVPTHLIWVRYREGTRPQDITAAHVFDVSGQRYRVLSAIDVDDLGRFTRVSVKELGATT